MATFAIATLGCKVNAYESEFYVQSMLDAGYCEVSFEEAADIYVINTCTVTNVAASKSRQKINQAIRQNADATICVVGCLAQTQDERINARSDIDVLLGSSQKGMLVELIKKARESSVKQTLIDDVLNKPVFENLSIDAFRNKTRAYLKIQDGCNQYCSYCIIPYARGKERSLPLNDALSTAQRLIESGHKEIVLSGIHTGRYGAGQHGNLCTLLNELIKTDIRRIRISSIEISEVTDELIDLIKASDKMAHHLHIPLQSGSDEILKRMNRPYTSDEYLKRIDAIRRKIPDISISTDIIVGFPQETDGEFEETLNFVRKAAFSFAHVFPYSKRQNTPAAAMEGQLDNEIKKKRVRQLIALSKSLYEAYQRTFIGKELTVLFETAKDGEYVGHSSEYIKVKAQSDRNLKHEMHRVVVQSFADNQLIGEVRGETE